MEMEADTLSPSKLLKTIIKYMVTFAVTAVVLLGLLCLAAKLPKEMIKTHTLESAEYLYGKELYGNVIEIADSSCIDKYADSILLNIAWNYDVRYPLRSVLLSAYCFTSDHAENENLLISVRDDMGPNQQYLRYWHGSIAIVRPLLSIMPIQGIYILNGIVLLGLFVSIMVMLTRMGEYVPAAGILLGVIMTSWCFVPFSLEYTWVCLVSLIACLVIISLSNRGKDNLYGLFFLITGMVTIFLDFLTTETLTLLLPLLILLWIERKKKQTVYTAVASTVSWGIGYVLMWVLKWVLTGLVFHENVLPYVSGHIEERLGGSLGISLPKYLFGAVSKNIGVMFPADYGIPGTIISIVMVIGAVCFGVRFRRKVFDKKLVLVIALLGLMPFIRFLILHNHSYRHYFFVHRALAATVLAVVLIFGEVTGFDFRKKR